MVRAQLSILRIPSALRFAANPLLFSAGWFAGGILLSHLSYEAPTWTLLPLLLASLVSWLASTVNAKLSLLSLALAWVGAGFFCAEIQRWPDPQAGLLAFASRSAGLVEGEVDRAGPVRTTLAAAPFSGQQVVEQSVVLDLRVNSVASSSGPPRAVDGGLRVTIYAAADRSFPVFRCGDRVRLTTEMHRPERYNDPGVWDSPAYLLGQGIALLAGTKLQAVSLLSGPRHPTFACRWREAQQKAGERIMALAAAAPSANGNSHLREFFVLSSEDASMLAAMITGDRSWLQRRTRIGFEKTGSFHLLVVSGLHLAIFAGILFWIAERLRLSRNWASLITIGLAFCYALFTGFGQPVQRSFWMVTLYLLGRLFWRERNPLNAIGFAALCLLAARPSGLFDAGFQMTLLSVVAIAGIAAPLVEGSLAPYLRATRNLPLIAIDSGLPAKVAQFRVSLRLLGIHLAPLVGKRIAYSAPAALTRLALRAGELLVVSVVVELVMSLPMALYFHRITILALPVNFLIVPFLGLLLPSALATFALLLVCPGFAAVPSVFTAALLHSVTRLIHVFAVMRAGDFRVAGPSAEAAIGFVCLLILAVSAAHSHRQARLACSMLLVAMAGLILIPPKVSRRPGLLEVTAIDVGQGDSLLLVTPDGKTLLVDAGGSPFGAPPGLAKFEIGEEVVSAYLWSRGIERLDAVALTHAHADHIGGMPAVIANFHPRELWVGTNPHSEAYDALLAQALSIGTAIRRHSAGEQFSFGGTQVQVLAPEPDYVPGANPSNNDSLVLRLRFGRSAALLEGDAEVPSERLMLAHGEVHADLLKIGHHGSRTSTTLPFLQAVGPSHAVISVGERNLYGHPRREILGELQAAHIRTWRTDMLGASTFYLDRERVVNAAGKDP